MTWKADEYKRVDDLFARLYDLAANAKQDPIACRGQADGNWSLTTSIDRLLDPKSDCKKRLGEEAAIIEKFCKRAHEYLGANELERVEDNLPKNKISALPVLQHYRAPTRLLDWTRSPYAALYFAAIDHHDKDGAVWLFKTRPFEKEVDRRWDDLYNMKRYPDKHHPERKPQVDLNDTVFNSDGPPWISFLECIIKFHRLEVQQGFFTVAGRLGLDHADLIEDAMEANKPRMTPSQYRKIIVPGLWKQRILDILKTMTIHSRSLDFPGADIVGNELTRELEEARRASAN